MNRDRRTHLQMEYKNSDHAEDSLELAFEWFCTCAIVCLLPGYGSCLLDRVPWYLSSVLKSLIVTRKNLEIPSSRLDASGSNPERVASKQTHPLIPSRLVFI